MEINFEELENAILDRSLLDRDGDGIDLGDILSQGLLIVWFASGVALLAYLIFAGFQFMTSGGDPNKAAMAKGKITNALTGFFIVFAAFWIVELVGIVFGIDSITTIF